MPVDTSVLDKFELHYLDNHSFILSFPTVETNGKITALPNADNSPLTIKDMKIKKEKTPLPIMLICDGKQVKENMEIAKIDENFLLKYIAKAGAFKIKDVAFASIDNNGKMYIEPKNKKFVTLNANFKGGDNW